MPASFMDALEQTIHERKPMHRSGLVHHSDRASQYLSIKYTERLAEAGIEPSVGSIGDSYDNALAKTYRRPLQSPGHSHTRALAVVRSGRICNSGMGRLVQQ